MDVVTSRIATAQKALAEAHTIGDIVDVRNKAEAARAYAKQARLSTDTMNECARIKLHAERRAGEVLRDMAKAAGTKGQLSGGHIVLPPEKQPTFADLGISKMQAHRWQKLAAIPFLQFREEIEATVKKGRELTTAAMLRRAKEFSQHKEGQPVTKEKRAGVKVPPGSGHKVVTRKAGQSIIIRGLPVDASGTPGAIEIVLHELNFTKRNCRIGVVAPTELAITIVDQTEEELSAD